LHVLHNHNGKSSDEHVTKPVSFMMTNKKGGYAAFGDKPFTHMQGLFFFDEKVWMPYKTIANLKLEKEMTSVKNFFAVSERAYEGEAYESFCMFNNSLLYSVKNYSGKVSLELDFRHVFDFDDMGRIYSISKEDNLIIIQYDKYSDNSLITKQRTSYLVVAGAGAFEKVDLWKKQEYEYDARRGEKSEFYTYNAIDFLCSNSLTLTFSFSHSKEDAMRHAKHALENRIEYVNKMAKYMDHAYQNKSIYANVAMKALDDLMMHIKHEKDRNAGLFAGLPWFYQYWSRDELISLRAFLLEGKIQQAKEVLMYYASLVGEDGLLPNRVPHSDVKSVDSVGWLFVRINDLFDYLSRKGLLEKHVSKDDLNLIRSALEKAIHGILHTHYNGSLVTGSLQESWMDTREARRSGCFIETQAFMLHMMRLHTNIAASTGGKQLFRMAQKELQNKVKAEFFKDGRLLDTVDGDLPGEISRPNIFLAYYIYPDLLSKEEWNTCFDVALKDLWLDWGGVATISHTTPYFNVEYTGKNDRSYHCGDSWYFVNNYAAIAMHRLNKDKYKKYVERIIHASREELMFSGFIGCSAELSSAKELRSEGCLSQAWSAATLVELENETRKD
jgi:glycogen debranching enzyme